MSPPFSRLGQRDEAETEGRGWDRETGLRQRDGAGTEQHKGMEVYAVVTAQNLRPFVLRHLVQTDGAGGRTCVYCFAIHTLLVAPLLASSGCSAPLAPCPPKGAGRRYRTYKTNLQNRRSSMVIAIRH